MQRTFTNILCENPARTAAFYERLLGMSRHADFGWFVILTHESMPGLEFGLLDRSHETVPDDLAAAPAGVIVTFVVEDVEPYFRTAQDMSAEIVQEPTNLFYGQRRLLLRDPEGTVIDVSSPTAS
jgi:predicted enzyme related to lactoylglutathione lyase